MSIYGKAIEESASNSISYKESVNKNNNKTINLEMKLGSTNIGEVRYYTKTGELFNLEIDEKYRGKGYGKTLLEEAIRRFDPEYIVVAKDNTIAYNMYLNHGFKVIDSFIDKEDDNKDSWYMKRKTIKKHDYQ